ncbi:unnamed protein product, partial [Mesorhabditis spiculigera]
MRKGRPAANRPSPSEEPWRGHMVFNMAFSDLVWVGLFITAVAAAAYLFPRTTEAWPIWWYCLGTAAAIAVVRWVIRPIYQWWSRSAVTFWGRNMDGSYTEHTVTLDDVRRMLDECDAEFEKRTRIRLLRQ